LVVGLDAFAGIGLRASVWLWGLMAVGAVFLTTLGNDEAWVLNGLKSYLTPPVPALSSEPVSTSGGLFALVNLAIEYAFGSRVWAHRLFSLACLFALVGLASWQGRARRQQARLDYIAIAPLLAVPGTAEVGTAAIGTSTGVTLLVLASWFWSGSQAPRSGRIVLCGILFGLSASSRFDLVLFAPALLLAASVSLPERSGFRLRIPWAALWVVAIGLALFVASQMLMKAAAHPIVMARLNVQETMAVTGLSTSFIDYPRLLNRVLIGTGFGIPAILILGSVAAFWDPPSDREPKSTGKRRFLALILAMAWVLWLGWVLRAPIPHLRYLWPSLALFGILGGAGLSQIHHGYSLRGESWRMAACKLIALVLVLGGAAGTFRSLVVGESDYLSWEWSREMGVDYFRRFQHAKDQHAAIAYLRNEIPKDATVLAYIPFSLRYLGERPVINTDDPVFIPHVSGRRTFLVLTPMVGTYLYLPPETFAWIETHARLKAEFGRYSLYELPDGPPEDATVLRVARTNYEHHPQSRPWFGRSPGREGAVTGQAASAAKR
jgi:hypothetical protein